jgi:hypothetical protein
MSRGVIWQAGAVEEDPLRAQERELLAKAEFLPLAQEESSLLARRVSFIVTFASWRGGFATRSPRLRLVQIIFLCPQAHPAFGEDFAVGTLLRVRFFKICAISN